MKFSTVNDTTKLADEEYERLTEMMRSVRFERRM